jgi:glycerate-2-kinase
MASVTARFLLKPGRKYEQAVKAFEPYDSIKEEYPEARAAGRALVAEGKAAGPKRRTFVFVNNRLEGNAISTIAAMLEPG